MVQPQKLEFVEETVGRLERSQSAVLVDYRGLTVGEMGELRSSLRQAGCELKVIKNRLARRALADAGCESFDDLLVGPLALAFGYEEPAAPAKICSQFAKSNSKLEIKAGLLGKQRIDLQTVATLARLPGRTELLARVASSLMAPAQQLVTALGQAKAKLVYAMKARAEQMSA